MISNHFQFQDYAQRFYSYTTAQRFFEVLSKHEQLQKILLSKRSLAKLQNQSKYYKNTLYLAAGGSVVTTLLFNKYFSFGTGYINVIGKFTISCLLLIIPTYSAIYLTKQKMQEVKTQAFEENKLHFKKYELTGDILLTNNSFELVE